MIRSANKAKGNISSVFAHLGASKPEIDPRFLDLKKQIAPKNPDILRKAFDRLLNTMEKEALDIRQRGSAVIPEVTIEDIKSNGGRLPDKIIPEVKKRGTVVIRNIVDRAVAAEYKSSIQDYINRHSGIVGFPEDNPQV